MKENRNNGCGCAPGVDSISKEKWTHGSTERVNRLRDQYWDFAPEIDVERTVSYTKTYKEMEAYEVNVKRATALYNYISEKTVAIQPDELIIGTYGKQPRAALICPEVCSKWVLNELDDFSTRAQDPYIISEIDKEILRQTLPYWRGRTMEDYYIANLTPNARSVAYQTNIVYGENKSQAGSGEFNPGYSNIVFKKGFKGIKEEAQKYYYALDQEDGSTHDKRKFYESIMIICDAAKVQSDRYAAEARKQAARAKTSERKAELERIADICERVPWETPRTMQEALQAIWFTQLLVWTEENATGYNIERIDQLLYPFYKAELESGQITELQAQEMLDCFWIKMAEIIYVIGEDASKVFSGYQPFHGIALGGCNPDGSDATNAISYMVLQATADTRLHCPTLNVRVNKNTCDEFMMAIADLVELGTGQPAIYFDETAFKILSRNGVPEHELYNWGVSGCVEPTIPGKMSMWVEGARYNYAMALEWTLFNGVSKIPGRRIGLETGDPRDFKTYEEFEQACIKQMEYMIKAAVQSSQTCERAHMMRTPTPVRSALCEGCVEQGLDAMSGGGIYNFAPGIESTGLTDLADGMAAVKKLVYEDKKITMDKLIEVLEADFEGYEDIRLMFVHGVPKYGNDDDYVDSIAARFCELSCDMCEKYNSPINGTRYVNGVVPASSNVPCGENTWAQPTGRKAGLPLSDGISPYPGYDKNGPSSVIKSITKLPHYKNGVGTLLNMKLSPGILKTEADKKNFIQLLRSEAELGGYHVQFNVISKDTLVAAQKKPEQYSDLLIRVAGYSAFFTSLRKETQDMLILRTEQEKW